MYLRFKRLEREKRTSHGMMKVNRLLLILKLQWLKLVSLALYSEETISCHQRVITMKSVLMLVNTESSSTTALAPQLPLWPSKSRTTKTNILSENGTLRRRWYHTVRAPMVSKTLPVEAQFAATSACVSTAFSTPCLKKLLMLLEMENSYLKLISQSKKVCLEDQPHASAGVEFSYAFLDTIYFLPLLSTS